MEPYDLEIGPVQKTFEHLFESIHLYFKSAPSVPDGLITETSFKTFSQDELHKTLKSILNQYGFANLPYYMRIVVEEDSIINGIYRSDNITIYEEKLKDGSLRNFNFYSTFGPENMKASYYSNDIKSGGEQTQGILTKDDRWYLRISTTEGFDYYVRMEEAERHW